MSSAQVRYGEGRTYLQGTTGWLYVTWSNNRDSSKRQRNAQKHGEWEIRKGGNHKIMYTIDLGYPTTWTNKPTERKKVGKQSKDTLQNARVLECILQYCLLDGCEYKSDV